MRPPEGPRRPREASGGLLGAPGACRKPPGGSSGFFGRPKKLTNVLGNLSFFASFPGVGKSVKHCKVPKI